MRKSVYGVVGLIAVILALAIAYCVGSIRGAQLAGFYRQSHKMYSHYLMAKTLNEKDYASAFRYSRDLAESGYRTLSHSPLMHGHWIVPVVDWGEGRPMFFFQVDEATRQQVDAVGSYLAEGGAKSNKSIQGTVASAPVPDL